MDALVQKFVEATAQSKDALRKFDEATAQSNYALVKKFVDATIQRNFSILKELHDLKNRMSFISVEITPSNCCELTKEQLTQFTRLNEIVGHRLLIWSVIFKIWKMWMPLILSKTLGL